MYNRAMKRAIAYHKLSHDEAARAQYNRLRLLPLPSPVAPPPFGKVAIPGHAYAERRGQIAQASVTCALFDMPVQWAGGRSRSHQRMSRRTPRHALR